MQPFFKAVKHVLNGALHAFSRYPAAMLSALFMAVTASVRLHGDYHIDADKLFDSMLLAALFSGFFGLLIATFAIRRKGQSLFFWLMNLGVILVGIAVFFIIWTRPGEIPVTTVTRLIAASAVSLIAFILLASYQSFSLRYHESLFLTIKSALIAALYALVIMLGFFFISFTVESLIYENLSSDVYAHIAIWSGFAWFAFFLGYFPSFGPDQNENEVATAKKIPQFIEILLVYVLIPLMTLLTIVLLIWVIQILLIGNWPSFAQLSVIFSIYTLFGIWLALTITSIEKTFSIWFRKLFPFAALVFLVFVTYALVLQIQTGGVKTGEYFVAILIFFAAFSSLGILVLSAQRQQLIGYLSILLLILMVLPYAGFIDFPAAMQAARLKNQLEANQMLQDNRIVSAADSVSQEHREIITDSTSFLLRNDEARKPAWFRDSIQSMTDFRSVYGFEAAFPEPDWGQIDQPRQRSVFLNLPVGALPVSRFENVLFLQGRMYMDPEESITFEGLNGSYELFFSGASGRESMATDPELTLTLNEQIVIEQSLLAYFTQLASQYRSDESSWTQTDPALDDMTLTLESDEIRLLLVFNMIEIYQDETGRDQFTFAINSLFWTENEPLN